MVAKKTSESPQVGLLAACDEPELFGFDLWPRQREVLGHVETYRQHVWALGRRSGKSTMAALVCLHDALFKPHLRKHLRPRERRYAVVVATNLRQARLVLDAARAIVHASPLLKARLVSETDDELVFETGCTVIAFPCTARGGRGWPISTLVMDESAHHFDTNGDSAAGPVFEALLPGTIQFGLDARVLICSTPYGADGWFADTYKTASAGTPEEAVAVTYTSAMMNPTLEPELLSAELERNPESFRGEWLAEFVGSGGAFIDAARLAECVADYRTLGRLDILSPIVGADLAFQHDPAGVVVVGKDPANPRRLLVARTSKFAPQRSRTFEERRQVEDSTLGDIAEIAKYYGEPGAALVVVDQYMSGPVSAFFQDANVPVKVLALSPETKSLAFAETRDLLYNGQLGLPDEPELLAELRGLRSQFKARHSSVVTPRTSRGHSDLAMALSLAVWHHSKAGLGPTPEAAFHRQGRWDSEAGSLARMADDASHGLSPGMRL